MCPPFIFLTMQYKPYNVEKNPQSNYLMFEGGGGMEVSFKNLLD